MVQGAVKTPTARSTAADRHLCRQTAITDQKGHAEPDLPVEAVTAVMAMITVVETAVLPVIPVIVAVTAVVRDLGSRAVVGTPTPQTKRIVSRVRRRLRRSKLQTSPSPPWTTSPGEHTWSI